MANKSDLQETFRNFVQQASQPNADAKFLEKLRRLTGQPEVAGMIQHFQKLAGIKPAKKK